MKKTRKAINSPAAGFTLIELLIVIAIIAVLAVVVIISLNPAELLAQSRDSNRMSALNAVSSAINDIQTDNLPLGTANTIYVSIPDSSPACADLGLPPLPTGYIYGCAPSSTYLAVDGTGWIPVAFNKSSLGSLLSTLPTDPINTTSSGHYYEYATNGNQWELWATPESQKYTQIQQTNAVPGYFTQGANLSLVVNGYAGLVGWWQFNDGSGSSVADSSGNGQNGTWQGTLGSQWGAGHNQTYARNFNGSNNTVSIPLTGTSAGVLSQYSMSAWISDANINTGEDGGIQRSAYDTAGNIAIDIYNDNLCQDAYFVTTHWNGTCSSYVVPQNTWQFYAITYDGATIKLYENGTSVLTRNVAGDSIAASGVLTVGLLGSTHFTGLIEGVRLYNYALSAAQITALYNLGK